MSHLHETPIEFESDWYKNLYGTELRLGTFLYGRYEDRFDPRIQIEVAHFLNIAVDPATYEAADSYERILQESEPSVDRSTRWILEAIFAWRNPQHLQIRNLIAGIRFSVPRVYRPVQRMRIQGIIAALQGRLSHALHHFERALSEARIRNLESWVIHGILADINILAYRLVIDSEDEVYRQVLDQSSEALQSDSELTSNPYTDRPVQSLYQCLFTSRAAWQRGKRSINHEPQYIHSLAEYTAQAVILGSYSSLHRLFLLLFNVCSVQADWNDSHAMHIATTKLLLLTAKSDSDITGFMNSHAGFLSHLTSEEASEIAVFISNNPISCNRSLSLLLTCRWLGNYLSDCQFNELISDIRSIASTVIQCKTPDITTVPLTDALKVTSDRQDPHWYLRVALRLLDKGVFPCNVLQMMRRIPHPEKLSLLEMKRLIDSLSKVLQKSVSIKGSLVPYEVSATLAFLRTALERFVKGHQTSTSNVRRSYKYIKLIHTLSMNIPPIMNANYLINFPEPEESVQELLNQVIEDLASCVSIDLEETHILDKSVYTETSFSSANTEYPDEVLISEKERPNGEEEKQKQKPNFLRMSTHGYFNIPRYFIETLECSYRQLLKKAIKTAGETLRLPYMPLDTKRRAAIFLLWASGGSELVVMDVVHVLQNLTDEQIFSSHVDDFVNQLVLNTLVSTNESAELEALKFSISALRVVLNVTNSTNLVASFLAGPRCGEDSFQLLEEPLERLTINDVFKQMDVESHMGILALLMNATRSSRLATRATAFRCLGSLLPNRHVGPMIAEFFEGKFDDESADIQVIIENAIINTCGIYKNVQESIYKRAASSSHFLVRQLSENLC